METIKVRNNSSLARFIIGAIRPMRLRLPMRTGVHN